MAKIPDAIKVSYESFSQELPRTLLKNAKVLVGNEKLQLSYCRLAGFNSIKRDIVDNHLAEGPKRFFYEAHNDLLLSHVNANLGSWRTALQSLRSFIENSLSTFYFADHPVEMRRWESGDLKIAPRELREYFCVHPDIVKLLPALKVKEVLDQEYATLSKAVHASNDLFRMTDQDGTVAIGNPNLADLGKWSTREQSAFEIVVVIALVCLKEHVEGARLPNLRKTLSLSMRKSSRDALKDTFGISIAEPEI